jgi:hypothetical protein
MFVYLCHPGALEEVSGGQGDDASELGGKKLYVHDKKGQFKDIQTYKRAHG